MIRYSKTYCTDWRYGSFRSWILTGDLYEKMFCYETIPDRLDRFDTKTFSESPMEFYAGTANVETGRPVFYQTKKGDAHDLTWIRASASMPVVSRIVKVDGYRLLDGGIADSVPLRFHFFSKNDRNLWEGGVFIFRIPKAVSPPAGSGPAPSQDLPAAAYRLRR